MQERFEELQKEIEKLSEQEKYFMLWCLLREYKDKLDVPERLDTVEQCREYIVKHKLLVGANDLIEMLDWELWG